MKTAVFSTKDYDRRSLEAATQGRHEWLFLEERLGPESATLAQGCQAVCAFVNDRLDAPTLEALHEAGVRFVALRCAGFNQLDCEAARSLGMRVSRVPAYSPHAVAEHATALLLALNRRIHRAYMRVREANFSLEGLGGFDLHGKTVGVVGIGKIGVCFAQIMKGFGCRVLAFDPFAPPNWTELGVELVELPFLLAHSDVVSLHCPLTPENHHLISADTLGLMRPGSLLINTSRGALIDTQALIEALKSGRLAGAGLDVYENEAALFFEDRSLQILEDDLFARLLTLPNVIITAHQAFLTTEALEAIASTTVANLDAFDSGPDIEANRVI